MKHVSRGTAGDQSTGGPWSFHSLAECGGRLGQRSLAVGCWATFEKDWTGPPNAVPHCPAPGRTDCPVVNTDHYNTRFLQTAFGWIRAISHSRKVHFFVPKTKLIHSRTLLHRDPSATPCPPPVALDGQIFHPSVKLQWQGYWFVPNLVSSAHFSRRLALHQQKFISLLMRWRHVLTYLTPFPASLASRAS